MQITDLQIARAGWHPPVRDAVHLIGEPADLQSNTISCRSASV